jgi:hypothetical protein
MAHSSLILKSFNDFASRPEVQIKEQLGFVHGQLLSGSQCSIARVDCCTKLQKKGPAAAD